MKTFTLILLAGLIAGSVCGQISPGNLGGQTLNAIQTSVPFLTIAPDARAAGMGDAGVATLMVPTPPAYEMDPLTGDEFIAYGMAPGSIIGGMFQSF